VSAKVGPADIPADQAPSGDATGSRAPATDHLADFKSAVQVYLEAAEKDGHSVLIMTAPVDAYRLLKANQRLEALKFLGVTMGTLIQEKKFILLSGLNELNVTVTSLGVKSEADPMIALVQSHAAIITASDLVHDFVHVADSDRYFTELEKATATADLLKIRAWLDTDEKGREGVELSDVEKGAIKIFTGKISTPRAASAGSVAGGPRFSARRRNVAAQIIQGMDIWLKDHTGPCKISELAKIVTDEYPSTEPSCSPGAIAQKADNGKLPQGYVLVKLDGVQAIEMIS
jgi:hypothetical protein